MISMKKFSFSLKLVSIMWWTQLLKFLMVLLMATTTVKCYKGLRNYKIYDIYAETQEQLLTLQKLRIENKNYDFLNVAHHSNVVSKVLIPPEWNEDFLDAMLGYSLNFTLIVEDVAEIIAQEQRENSRDSPQDYPLDVFERYYRHDEINEHLDVLAKLYPSRVFIKRFGRSYENRSLNVITITNGDTRSDKKVVFIDAAMHAREWIAPAMALHIIHQLTDNYESHKALLMDYDWVILPVVNADGYEYTHDEYRYWRKTRRPTSDADCFGTDPNRNFDHHWGWEEGASADPCDDLYHGEKAFSEPETQVVRDIMHHYGGRMKWYLTLHSYGNYILLPWGHTGDLPDNYFEMMDVADAGAMAIVLTTGGIYTYGNTFKVMYPTSGDSADYAAAVINTPVSMCMELPAGGFLGFDPPVRQIEQIVSETWIGIHAMAEVVVEKY